MSDDASGSAAAEQGLVGANHGVASFDEEAPGPIRRLQAFLHSYPTAIPFIVLIVGIAIFSVAAGSTFFTPFNLSLVLQQVTIIGVLGIAQTLIILTAGIDLSVGAIMILSSIVMGRLSVTAGVPVEISFVLGIGTGILCGLINGVLVAVVKLPHRHADCRAAADPVGHRPRQALWQGRGARQCRFRADAGGDPRRHWR